MTHYARMVLEVSAQACMFVAEDRASRSCHILSEVLPAAGRGCGVGSRCVRLMCPRVLNCPFVYLCGDICGQRHVAKLLNTLECVFGC